MGCVEMSMIEGFKTGFSLAIVLMIINFLLFTILGVKFDGFQMGQAYGGLAFFLGIIGAIIGLFRR
jgi:hypothetical protein